MFFRLKITLLIDNSAKRCEFMMRSQTHPYNKNLKKCYDKNWQWICNKQPLKQIAGPFHSIDKNKLSDLPWDITKIIEL
jgi:hypothetical protein